MGLVRGFPDAVSGSQEGSDEGVAGNIGSEDPPMSNQEGGSSSNGMQLSVEASLRA
jgi:hypothetical protein